MNVMAKECKIGYYDLNGEYREVDLKSRKEVILTFKTRFIATDDNYLVLESIDGKDEFFVNGNDILEIEVE